MVGLATAHLLWLAGLETGPYAPDEGNDASLSVRRQDGGLRSTRARDFGRCLGSRRGRTRWTRGPCTDRYRSIPTEVSPARHFPVPAADERSATESWPNPGRGYRGAYYNQEAGQSSGPPQSGRAAPPPPPPNPKKTKTTRRTEKAAAQRATDTNEDGREYERLGLLAEAAAARHLEAAGGTCLGAIFPSLAGMGGWIRCKAFAGAVQDNSLTWSRISGAIRSSLKNQRAHCRATADTDRRNIYLVSVLAGGRTLLVYPVQS